MKIRQAYFFTITALLVLLFLLNCYQFNRNKSYEVTNRKLILQNDSLIAVTIELKRQIDAKIVAK